VDDVGRFADLGVEQPRRVGRGDHERRDPLGPMLSDQPAEIAEVRVPVNGLDGDDLGPGHRAAGGIRPVGVVRGQHDPPLVLALVAEVRADDLERRVLAVGARGRLERSLVEPRDLLEIAPRLVEQAQRSLDLGVVLQRV
jgi:hypothetical protein